MALARRGARAITVDGNGFLWRVRWRYTNPDDHSGELQVSIFRPEDPAPLLILVPSRERWLDIAQPDRHPDEAYPTMTPHIIANMIQAAGALGWKPGEPKTRTFRYDPATTTLSPD